MNENTPQAGAGHERTDVHARKVMFFGLAMILVVVAGGLVATVLFYQQWEKGSEDSAASPLLQVPQSIPEPRLQMNPMQDYKVFRAKEQELLASYGWVDRANGVVRIPVDRALDLVAQRGLPKRPDSAGAPAGLPGAAGTAPALPRVQGASGR
jgi:hypothetical protein